MSSSTQAPASNEGGQRLGPLLACLLAAALFGASSPASKELLGSLSPLTLAGLLYLGAALAVAPFSLRGGSRVARRQGRNLLRLAGVALFGGVLGPLLLLVGLQRAPAASVSLWLNLEAPATALLGFAFFREHLDRRVLAALVLVTGATAWLAGASGMALVPAALLVAGACLCWGLDNNLSATIDGFTPAQSTLVKGLAAGSVNLAAGLWLDAGPGDGARLAGGTVGLALLVGALAYGASIVLYVRGAQQLGAVRSQLLFSAAPFFGVGLSWLALGEPVELAQVGAAVLMLLAVMLLHRERHEHPHTHSAQTHTHWHRHDDDHHGHAHEPSVKGGHVHEHQHGEQVHQHPHRPDLHHRHSHG